MQKRYLTIIAILGAIAGLNLGMVAEHVQASYDPGRGDCGQRGYSWEFCGYTQKQQPTMTLIDHGYGPGCDTGYHWNPDTGNCVENSYVQQPHIQQVVAAIVEPTNCFWSYPVQCNQN